MNIFHPCFLIGHQGDPLIMRRGNQLVKECRRCQANLGPVLKGQKFKARKQPSKVVTFQRKQKAG